MIIWSDIRIESLYNLFLDQYGLKSAFLHFSRFAFSLDIKNGFIFVILGAEFTVSSKYPVTFFVEKNCFATSDVKFSLQHVLQQLRIVALLWNRITPSVPSDKHF